MSVVNQPSLTEIQVEHQLTVDQPLKLQSAPCNVGLAAAPPERVRTFSPSTDKAGVGAEYPRYPTKERDPHTWAFIIVR